MDLLPFLVWAAVPLTRQKAPRSADGARRELFERAAALGCHPLEHREVFDVDAGQDRVD
jgi:hypothetical protein